MCVASLLLIRGIVVVTCVTGSSKLQTIILERLPLPQPSIVARVVGRFKHYNA